MLFEFTRRYKKITFKAIRRLFKAIKIYETYLTKGKHLDTFNVMEYVNAGTFECVCAGGARRRGNRACASIVPDLLVYITESPSPLVSNYEITVPFIAHNTYYEQFFLG